MNARTVVLIVLIAFSMLESLIVVGSFLSGATAGPAGGQQPTGSSNPIVTYSPPLSVAGWIGVALVVFQGRRTSKRSRLKSLFVKRGLGEGVYDLMVGMRGGTSRLALLQNMETPRHRLELSEITGIDWKEVDRELGVLEKYGLVKMYAQSGTVRLYQVTEQGRLLVRVLEELNDGGRQT